MFLLVKTTILVGEIPFNFVGEKCENPASFAGHRRGWRGRSYRLLRGQNIWEGHEPWT